MVCADLSDCLDFGHRIDRQQQLANLHAREATLDWVWESDFSAWLKMDSPLFWISGNPASGKSTLMNYLASAQQTKALLEEGFDGKWTCINHFFDFRAGAGIANNFEGLLRSLLFQFLKEIPDVVFAGASLQALGSLSRKSQKRYFNQLGIGGIRQILIQAVQQIKGRMMILLDGLDEYAGEKVDLIVFINELCTKDLKICLASRPEPPFPDAFCNIPSFEMHRLNRKGIHAFITQTTYDMFPQYRLVNQPQIENLAQKITELSQGVFLWAQFAVYELVKGFNRGEEPGSRPLWQRLEEMPRELEHIYSRIVRNLSSEDRSIAHLVLLLVTSACETVTVELLQYIVPALSEFLSKHPIPPFPDEMNSANLKKRILAATGGLIEALPGLARWSMDDQELQCFVVRLIHRSVKNYLDAKGWEELSGARYHPALPHEYWLQACVRIVKAAHSLISTAQPDDEPYSRFWYPTIQLCDSKGTSRAIEHNSHQLSPTNIFGSAEGARLALSYAISYLPTHASNWEAISGKSTYSIIKDVLYQQVVILHASLFDGTCACQRRGNLERRRNGRITDAIHLAIGHSLSGFVVNYLEEKNEQSLSARKMITPQSCEATPISRALHLLSSFRDLTISEEAMVFEYAHDFAVADPGPERVKTLQTILKFYPKVTESHVLMAVKGSSFEVVRELLLYCGNGKLQTQDSEELALVRHRELLNKSWRPWWLGLFWAVGKRRLYEAQDPEDTERIIGLLLERGDDINAQCGPFGTALHSLVDEIEYTGSRSSRMLEILLRNGLNINTQGQLGNGLEFLWRLANTSRWRKMKYVYEHRNMIQQLIRKGATNNQEDPNGLVPSVEAMMNWGKNWDAYQECKRFYMHGPAEGSRVLEDYI
jgi:hypothetical protein